MSHRGAALQNPLWDELSFLAPPGRTADWRMVLLYDAAADAGVISSLPGSPKDLAAGLGLDVHAVRVVLDALAVWDVVKLTDGRYLPGPNLPTAEAAAVWRHHARSIRLWSRELEGRLRSSRGSASPSLPPGLALWLEGLAVNARESAPAAVDACLTRVPGARRVLDLGGGHGEYALEFARRGVDVTMQDRPEVVELVRRVGDLEDQGVELFAGDFFEVLPGGHFDVVFCAGVTYTYDGETNLRLARTVKGVVATGGVFAVLTFLRDAVPVAPVFAVQMLAVGRGGDTHSYEDYRGWLLRAGFESVDAKGLVRPGESLVFASVDGSGR